MGYLAAKDSTLGKYMGKLSAWFKSTVLTPGTLIGFTLGVIIIGLPALFVNTTTQLGELSTGAALSFIELIALIIPALAILLQINIQISRSSGIALLGHGGELRKVSLYAAVTSLGFLALALVSLEQYMALPSTLSLSLKFIIFAVLLLAALPALPALLYTFGSSDEFGTLTDSIEAYSNYKKIEGLAPHEVEILSRNLSVMDSEDESESENEEVPESKRGTETEEH